MDFTSIGGTVIHYRDSAEAGRPALVFSNSLGTDFRIWDDVVALLGDGFRYVRYDKRGHGLSGLGNPPYRMADHVGDLAGLLDALDIRDAIVCGLSVGGLIAQGLYATRPELVRGLILCDTGHRIGNEEMWNSRIAAIEAGGIEAIADAVLERWFSKAFREGRRVALEGWRAMLTRTPQTGYTGTATAIRDTDFTEEAKRIAVPALCVVGDEDGATPPDLVRSMAELIPAAQCRIISGAGHLPCIEKPDELAKLIARFTKEAGLV